MNRQTVVGKGSAEIKVYKGKSVFEGIAIGKICLIKIKKRNIVCIHVEDVESEIARKNQAVEETDIQLRMLYEKAMPEIGEENAAIFEVHRMMLRDSYYQETIENIIRSQGVNAEYAVGNTADHFAGMLEIMDDDYMKARVADVRDVSERLIAVLMGNNSEKLFKTLSGEMRICQAEMKRKLLWRKTCLRVKRSRWTRTKFWPLLPFTVQRIRTPRFLPV